MNPYEKIDGSNLYWLEICVLEQVMIPLANIGTVNPVVVKESPPEKYVQIVTTDGHEFWFMGFINFEKASHHLLDSVSDFRTAGNSAQPVVG